MSKRVRRIYFYILILLFILLSVGTVFYAGGWRFDIWTLRINRVGAIYIRSFPSNAEISLNTESVKNGSWFFQNGTFVNNLFPKNYNLHLSLSGYNDWHELITVQPMLVSEAKYAVLVPNTPEKTAAITSSIEDFNIFNDGFLLKNSSGTWTWQTKTISGDTILGWTMDYKKILSLDSKKNIFYWTDADTFTSININTFLKKLGVGSKDISFYLNPDDNQRAIAWTNNKLWLIDFNRSRIETIESISLSKKSTSTPIIENTIAAKRFLVAWTEYDTTNSLVTLKIHDTALDADLNGPDPINGEALKIGWITKDKLALLQKNGDLYFYTISTNELKKITSEAKGFEINKDASLIAILKNNNLEITPLLENNGDDYRQFRLPGNDQISKITWYKDGRHLFLNYPDHISFLDIDDRGLDNLTTVTHEINHTEYDPLQNIFYFMKDKTLWNLEFPNS